MKRKLCNAYDRMIMPDRCANTIERKMQERLDQQKQGRYVGTVAPAPVRRSAWPVAAAACLLLVLFAGMGILFQKDMEDVPVQAIRTTTNPGPGDYTMVTDIPAEEVEAFAASVRQNVLEGDWEEFAKKINYPVTIYDRQIGNEGGLVGLTLRNAVKDDFVEEISQESCNQMFCNWQGICMADGRIWINDVEGQLKIMAINDMFGELVDYTDFRYGTSEDGNFTISAYLGGAESVIIPTVYEQKLITQVGMGEPVIRKGNAVKKIVIPDSVTVVKEKAFADCPGLKAVFFRGDAPPEADGVFDGSENVIVYYNAGTNGWGETWCGREIQRCIMTDLDISEVRMREQKQNQATTLFTEVLTEKACFTCELTTNPVTITEYCEMRSEETGMAVTAPHFTMVDMDRDGIKELVLRLSIEGDAREDYLILRWQEGPGNDKDFVYAFMEPRQKMADLKKDGSFYWREGGPGQGESRLLPDPDRGTAVVASSMGVSGEGNGVDPLWHTWPCVRPEIILKSYEYAGTGQNVFPGSAWYVFEGIVNGTMENRWKLWREELTRWGAVCLEEDGEVSVYDPDAPGCRMFGTLDAEHRLVHIGYYISNEFGEREAKVRYVYSPDRQYIMGSHLEDLDAHGRETAGLEELLEYLS